MQFNRMMRFTLSLKNKEPLHEELLNNSPVVPFFRKKASCFKYCKQNLSTICKGMIKMHLLFTEREIHHLKKCFALTFSENDDV